MTHSLTDWFIALLPWVWLAAGALICLLFTQALVLAKHARDIAIAASLLAVGSAFAELYRGRTVANGVFEVAGSQTSHLAPGSMVIDTFTLIIVIAMGAFAVVALLLSSTVFSAMGPRAGLACAFLLGSEGSADLLSAQHEMAALILGVGGLLYCTTALIACLKTDHLSVEVAVKSVVAGGFLVSTLSVGLALLYGVTASTAFSGTGGVTTLAIGATLVVVALMGVCGALPLPQIPVSVGLVVPAGIAGWVMTATVSGVLAALIRIAAVGFNRNIHGWGGVMGLAGALTVMYAGVRAWREPSVRGVVSYLVVAQTGSLLFALMSFGAGSDSIDADGVKIAVAGVVASGAVTMAAFAVVGAIEHAGVDRYLHDVRSLLHRNGTLGLFLAVSLLALAGAPATIGFFLRAFGLASSAYVNKLAVGVLAMGGTLVCIVAALRVIAALLVSPTHETKRVAQTQSLLVRSTVAFAVISVVALGLLPGPLMQLGNSAATAIFAR